MKEMLGGTGAHAVSGPVYQAHLCEDFSLETESFTPPSDKMNLISRKERK